MLAEEQEATGRLRRSQSEAQKQAQALEFNLRELVDNCTQLENAKMGLEQQLMGLQADLEAERQDRSLGTEIILDLQGETGDEVGAGARVVRSVEFAILHYFKVKYSKSANSLLTLLSPWGILFQCHVHV